MKKHPKMKMPPKMKIAPKELMAAKFMPKAPTKDGMAPPKIAEKLKKIKPGDAKPSYKGLPGDKKMKALGATAKFRKKGAK